MGNEYKIYDADGEELKVGDEVVQVQKAHFAEHDFPKELFPVLKINSIAAYGISFKVRPDYNNNPKRFKKLKSINVVKVDINGKETNPKDAVGIQKWRQFTTVPMTVLAEVGVAMLEGARKYGRHNYRVAGVRTSVYVDAAMGHIMQYWEGENIDPDSGLPHIDKAIASLMILRDAEIQGKLTDDRPPVAKLDAVRSNLQGVVDELFKKHPEAKKAFTEKDQ